jgi:hypothetical protein
MPTHSIILPTYNERDNIAFIVCLLIRTLSKAYDSRCPPYPAHSSIHSLVHTPQGVTPSCSTYMSLGRDWPAPFTRGAGGCQFAQ